MTAADLSLEQHLLTGSSAALSLAGTDEVGRGAWAGPLLIAAAGMTAADLSSAPAGLADSKTLTAARRAALAPAIRDWIPVGLGWATSREIDEHGMAACLRLASGRALDDLAARDSRFTCPEVVLQDGSARWIPDTRPSEVLVRPKLDLSSALVAAASIVAKQARDAHMRHLADLFPTHPALGSAAGYGTAAHRAQIAEHGLTPVHRASWSFAAPYRQG